ncbi:MAG: YdcF family protein [Dokdonella sp.]|uniref:YdcF family protein n=1 Tax=Dokdonella sp. TaxID=2291710 RepID=UPI003F82022E
MLSPLRLLLLVGIAWWIARRMGWRRLRLLCAAIATVLVVLTTPLGANALVRVQEARAPAPSGGAGAPPQAVVVLSGGLVARPRGERDYAALGLASIQRLLAAVALQRGLGPVPLAVVGTSDRGVADSVILANLARDLGADASLLQVETASLNTWQNAQASAALAPALPRRIWLVTSSLHMARSLVAFRAAGFDACSYPAQPRYYAPDNLGYLLPTGSATMKAEDALHELVGELAYRLRAWRAAHD